MIGMKKVLLAFVILNLKVCIGQVSNGIEFLEFALMDSHDKAVLMGSDWVAMESNRFVQDNDIVEDAIYWRYYNDVKYLLTLRNVLNSNTGIVSTYVTKISVADQNVFNVWMNEWKKEGIEFVKDSNDGDKWLTPSEPFYVIYMEKKTIKDIPVFEISVIIESNVSEYSTDRIEPSSDSIKIDSAEIVFEEDQGGMGEVNKPKKRQILTTPNFDDLNIFEKCKIEYHIKVDKEGVVKMAEMLDYKTYIDESQYSWKEKNKRSKAKDELLTSLKYRIQKDLKFESWNTWPMDYILVIEFETNPLKSTVSYRPLR